MENRKYLYQTYTNNSNIKLKEIEKLWKKYILKAGQRSVREGDFVTRAVGDR